MLVSRLINWRIWSCLPGLADLQLRLCSCLIPAPDTTPESVFVHVGQFGIFFFLDLREAKKAMMGSLRPYYVSRSSVKGEKAKNESI